MSSQIKSYLFVILITAIVLLPDNVNGSHAKLPEATSRHSNSSKPNNGQSRFGHSSGTSGNMSHSTHKKPGGNDLNSLNQTSPSSGNWTKHSTIYTQPKAKGILENGSQNTRSLYPTPKGGLSGSGTRIPRTSPSSGNWTKHSLAIYSTSKGILENGSQNTRSLYPTPEGGLSGSGTRTPRTSQTLTTTPVSNGKLSKNKSSTLNNIITSLKNTVSNYRTEKQQPQENHHHHHNRYHYTPPTAVHYTPSHGTAFSYPVYTGNHIPQYVYKYRSSKNKYRRLLAGLALYNLGIVYSSHSKKHYHKTYVYNLDEICMFGVQYRAGNYDEMAVDCKAITSFIWEEESKLQTDSTVVNQNTITKVENSQILLQNGIIAPEIGQAVNTTGTTGLLPKTVMLPNITLISMIENSLRETAGAIPLSQVLQPYGVDDISDPKFNGNHVHVKSDMECYVKRITRISEMRKSVPCGLLQTYTLESLRYNAANISKLSSLALVLLVFISL